ncbi:class I SAM-dependent methyltransferase [Parerythrobacter aestuarii]|uniref:class I SAM-dependent methyltransferase n=1 Tax=Parerythrobacter aestuarii TaxID=3020909 RepID=UPI0024DE379B|nr:class I SAM-dependent methyltransferase [Parerythrobacter aestuarii]
MAKLSPDQIEILDANLAVDELTVLADFLAHFDISGKRVLELGGCIPASMTKDAAIWWSVDPAHAAAGHTGHQQRIPACAEDLPDEIHDVDLVFACNSFQHIESLESAYRQLAGVMRPGAAIFAHYGPIWTAPDGMHFENVELDGGCYSFWDGAKMPSWSHLVLEPYEFLKLAIELNGESDGRRLAEYVESSTWINRLSLAQHLALPQQSGFRVESAQGARQFGYAYEPPAIPAWCARRFCKDQLDKSFSRHAVTAAEALYRDLRLVLVKQG